ncbi:ATP synthase F0 subunit A [Candidatus Roizmanbacteria bacterium CG22_combo_CG10-13_8_21_14_all_35_9]|uniref:ATP synthase subunit a n=4 Tax=Candidatus Roizmaniibacteriota TaxID=1752723 RepID=A0A2M8F3Q1_9BACT|nr:MAG: ATP synthase F0 subunit A [Candidatus Roizmanbacteria bacterium CG23_combo_of_CG06-09_8_20_14_all_35_49]PIP63108.1 MAG: ATP synthase F0 subunit A [Candidatus Roizmanbacteria bacterium CG22_combo_CG10-13_8_21_14_all_35_9]PIY70725.1 MAG: ATP synthase F0 subunit A [Candidatus Roizmanbacteria bacterium CG_4_10_14_0_8_um_filter_35_28]PJC33919.1 MAG: ATP synthase F0 subunit A [Candidatus Roizmanbacteria bacterium CG_4_9_14_0_2_um_filter_35_15]PJC83194.1 MAG: ATP synthase F0 subunit A [Candida
MPEILTKMPEISIKAEPLFKIGSFAFTNSLFTSLIVFFLFLLLGLIYNKEARLKKKSQFYYLINFILKTIYQLFESILKEKTMIFFPIFAGFFLYILLNNWFGLLPGIGSLLFHHLPIFRGNNADLNATISLALIAFVLIQLNGMKYLGVKGYLKKFFNISNPINFFVGILETISEFSKIISFSFRLFGNIFAGEVLITIMAFLIPVLVTFPFLLLEVFVGLIQALVFSMLSAVFLSMAISHH